MSAALAGILAGAMLEFHGVIGQSAAPGEPPLAFTGVSSIIELPGERVLFIGDDGGLYEIVDGHPVFTGKPAHGGWLDFDGVTLRSFGQYSGVWEIDPLTLDARRVATPSRVRWDLAGVRPETGPQPFAGRCKFVTWNPGADTMEAYDGQGVGLGALMPMPEREGTRRVEGFGFLPGSGDLLMLSYWPDMRIRRFRADGSEVIGKGWPVRRGMGFLRGSGGRIFHCGPGSILPLSDSMEAAQRPFTVGREQILTGYARQGGREYIGTSQGLYVRAPGESSFNRRLGGIRKLTALAVCDGKVFMSMGEKIRWMYLDGDGNEPFGSSDALEMRIDNGRNWTNRILDIAPEEPGVLKIAAGNAGRWRFTLEPPLDYARHRAYWTQESKERCERLETNTDALPEPSELAALLNAAGVPGGFEIGRIASDGEWLVVEDVKNHRLLRFHGVCPLILHGSLRDRAEAVAEHAEVDFLRRVRQARRRDHALHGGAARRELRDPFAHFVLRNAERGAEFDEVGGRVESEFFVGRRVVPVGEELKPGRRRLVREMQRRVQKVVCGGRSAWSGRRVRRPSSRQVRARRS